MAVDYINALNAGTGLNTTEIVDGLITATRTPLDARITKSKEDKTVSISSLSQLKQTLTKSQAGFDTIEGTTGLKLDNSGTAIDLTLTNSNLASAFSNKVEVTQLAAGQTLVFAGFTSSTQSLGTGSLAFNFGTWSDNSFSANSARTDKTIALANGADNLTNLKDAINAANMDVTASIVKTGADAYSLMLKAREGAAHAMRITTTADSRGSALSNIAFTSNEDGNTTQTVAGNDASLKLDSVTVIRDSNKIADLINGMTLELKATTTVSGGDTLSATFQEATSKTALESLITEFNTLSAELSRLTKRGLDGVKDGELAGDPYLSAQLRALRKMTTTAISGFGDATYYLTSYGVQTNKDGSLSLDEKKFKAAYDANPAGIASLLNSKVVSTNTQVEGSVSGKDYIAGKYSLSVSSGTATLDGNRLSSVGTTYSALLGGTKGVSLDITGTDLTSDIYLGRSMAQTLSDFTAALLKTGGTIDTKITTLNTALKEDDKDLTQLNDRMEQMRARYVSQFGAMEVVSMQMKRTGESLTNMMDSWRASLDN